MSSLSDIFIFALPPDATTIHPAEIAFSAADDVDFNNWYGNSSTYTNRVGGVQKGFSGDHVPYKGTIRVGALDCAVEPDSEKQGATKFNFRKTAYSSNGPMITVWAPAEMTMAASYGDNETYDRDDDSNYHDQWFNGTSSASPNCCSVIALELQTNPKSTQTDIIKLLSFSIHSEVCFSSM